MPKLTLVSENKTLLNKLTIATSFKSRAIGLIGCKNLPIDNGVWFPKTNWVHTSFMSIEIEVIYLDKKMKVVKLHKLKPWRFPKPVLKANSVIEVSAQFINHHKIQIGDELRVGH